MDSAADSAEATRGGPVVDGTSSGAYDWQAPSATLSAGSPLDLVLDGLAANTHCCCRLHRKTEEVPHVRPWRSDFAWT